MSVVVYLSKWCVYVFLVLKLWGEVGSREGEGTVLACGRLNLNPIKVGTDSLCVGVNVSYM